MRMCERQIMPQPKRVKREVRLENQPKTVDPLLLTLRYARPPPMSNVGTRAYQGRPQLSALLMIYSPLLASGTD